MANHLTLVEQFIESIVDEEVDKALAMSDQRRKEFKDGIKNSHDNDVIKEFDQLNLKAKPLNTEADAATPPPVDPNIPPTAASPAPASGAPDPTGTPAGAATGDPNAPATGADPAVAGAPGADPAGDPNADPTADPASGGSGFGGFGGGGGGGGGDTGGEPGPEAAMAPTGEPQTPQGDPIVAMVSGAQEMLNQTQDPNIILKSLKGEIQTMFSQPEHALGLVKALYDTQDSILMAVAMRLYMFIKTSSS